MSSALRAEPFNLLGDFYCYFSHFQSRSQLIWSTDIPSTLSISSYLCRSLLCPSDDCNFGAALLTTSLPPPYPTRTSSPSRQLVKVQQQLVWGFRNFLPLPFFRSRTACFNRCWPLTFLSCLPFDDRRVPQRPSLGQQLSTTQNRALRSHLYRLVGQMSELYAPVKRYFRPEARSQHDRRLLKSWATPRGQRHVEQGARSKRSKMMSLRALKRK